MGAHHKAKAAALCGFAALALLLAPAGRGDEAPFTPAELRAVLALGPWPAPDGNDASNRVSGKAEAIEFGERLFFDPRLSASGKFACATCHVPERNWTDNLTRGAAAAEVDRNTPTLMNARLGKRFGWDGAADTLWAQSRRPILDARELGASARLAADLVRKDEQLACRYRASFGAAPSATDDEGVLTDIAKALAAFVETLSSPATPFDRFRDAVARGEPVRPWTYSEAALRGLKTFVGKGGCTTCHSGPNFSDGGLHDNGFSVLAAAGRGDPGKDGKFKVPTLRHLLLTAPYGHHGELGTLSDVVRHYSERGGGEVKPLHLSAAEQSDLVVFLESVSTMANPWRPDDGWRCR
jgi:cytochrome c peroxidase